MGRGGRSGGSGGRSSGGGMRSGGRSSGGSRGGGFSSRGNSSFGSRNSSSSFGRNHSSFGSGFGSPFRSHMPPSPPSPPPHMPRERPPVNRSGKPIFSQPIYHSTHIHISQPSATRDTTTVNSFWQRHFSAIIAVIVILAILVPVFFVLNDSDITHSTIDRNPLPTGSVIETGYFTDNLGWIENTTRLETGMKYFYKKTGVQPFLFLTDTVNGNSYPSEEEMDTFANELYDDFFDDEAHLLVVFQEYESNGNYYCYYVAGKQAKTVFDKEAADILFDYVDRYYYSDLDESDFFAAVFEDTADRMMTKTGNPLVLIAISIAVVICLFILFYWWKKVKEQKNLEAEQTERILKTDIDDLKSEELQNLEEKYSNDE